MTHDSGDGRDTDADSGGGIGTEDVLAGDLPAGPLDVGERTSFRRRRDVVFALLLTVVAVGGVLLVWRTSDVHATTSQTYAGPAADLAAPTRFPPSLGEAWRARSPATPTPVAVGPAVVTGNGGAVAGRDPLSGKVRWRYDRDLTLCTVAGAWDMAVSVYQRTSNLLPPGDSRKAGGCSEVTALDPATGRRGRQPEPGEEQDRPDLGQRDSDAELGTRLLFDGSYVTTTGSHLLTTWRSDLVQTMEYGAVPAVKNPDKQPRSGCTYGTVTVVQSRIGVLERCPDDSGDRLTVYRATGEDDEEKPEVVFSVVVGGPGARVVALTDQCKIGAKEQADVQLCAAVLTPNPARLIVLDERGEQVAVHPLAPGDLGKAPADHVVPTTVTPNATYWYTGSRTIALSPADLRPMWTVNGALGSGTPFATRMLVPVPDGLAVLEAATGRRIGTLPVGRGSYRGPVTMATLGPMVFEQRGETLVALH